MVKIKRRRKPMTPEQKAAAVERLAKAREAKGPAQHQNICPEVLTRPDDHPLCLKNVRSWIKSTKEQITALRGEVRRDVKVRKRNYIVKRVTLEICNTISNMVIGLTISMVSMRKRKYNG